MEEPMAICFFIARVTIAGCYGRPYRTYSTYLNSPSINSVDGCCYMQVPGILFFANGCIGLSFVPVGGRFRSPDAADENPAKKPAEGFSHFVLPVDAVVTSSRRKSYKTEKHEPLPFLQFSVTDMDTPTLDRRKKS